MNQKPAIADRQALLKHALEALDKMQAKLAAAERASHEPIAIIGMGCRFPGRAETPEAFWQFLRRGGDAIQEVPPDRWTMDAYYDPDPDAPGKIYTRRGGFLEQVDVFDAKFFGISPREARRLDPQQRLILEVTWHALEHAGQAPDRLRGARVGVFVGIGSSDYAGIGLRRAEPAQIDPYTGSGGGLCFAAGRVSYCLGLEGPSLIVDTACSSSLVAVHLACQSLRAGECAMALAGGVHLMLSPETFIYLSRLRALAPDGRCKAFDARADGFARGEGCGVVVLKRLSDAVAQGDLICAVIRGSALNQDGASSGLTVPNGSAQQAVLREALRNARVDAEQIGFVEAHGTGTALGDPIEMAAILEVLGRERPPGRPLVVGSVKTNLGHLEAAAGIASLIKAVLAVQHAEIPPNLHFQKLNAHIDPGNVDLVIPGRAMPWPAGCAERLVGVSSFGLSGTNAHIILGPAPATQPAAPAVQRPWHILALSARDAQSLGAVALQYAGLLEPGAVADWADICHSANTGRTHFDQRMTVAARGLAEARFQMERLLAGATAGAEPERPGLGATPPRIAFLFSGQGSQYAGMGRQLYETQPEFRRVIDHCSDLLAGEVDMPLLAVLYPKADQTSPIGETRYAQPALFALEYALAQLWRAWGIEPAVVLGHGAGEYVAACIAEVFSLEEGLRLMAERGRMMQQLPAGGAVDGMMAESAHSAGELDRFEQAAARVTFRAPKLPLVSNLSGAVLPPREVPDAPYWRRQACQPVRLAESCTTLQRHGYALFLEVGPHPALTGMARRCLPADYGQWLPSLQKDREDWPQMIESLGRLYQKGVKIDWTGFDRPYRFKRLVLPGYPFRRQRFAVQQRETPGAASSVHAPAGSRPGRHPLLQRRLRSPSQEFITYESDLSVAALPFLAQHQVHGSVVCPLTVYLEMLRAAAADAYALDHPVLEKVEIQQPLLFAEGTTCTVQLILRAAAGGRASFSIYSMPEGLLDLSQAWTLHVRGELLTGALAPESQIHDLENLKSGFSDVLATAAYYEMLQSQGFNYGPLFQGIAELRHAEGAALGRIIPAAMPAGTGEGYWVHPALLDACLQAIGAALPAEADKRHRIYMPFSLDRIRFETRPGADMWSHVAVRRPAAGNRQTLSADVHVMDSRGQTVVELSGLQLRASERQPLSRGMAAQAGEDCLYQLQWRPMDGRRGAGGPQRWIIFADAAGLGGGLKLALSQRGHQCIMVRRGEERPPAADDPAWQADGMATGIAFLWGLDDGAGPLPCGLTAIHDRLPTIAALLELLKVLSTVQSSGTRKLWIVTRGALAGDGRDDCPALGQAPLVGLARTIQVEHPGLWGGLLDLDPSGSDALAVALLSEALGAATETCLAVGPERWLAQRLTPYHLPRASTASEIHARGTYWITGGLGGIGFELMQWLVRKGAGSIVLMGRSAPNRETEARLAELRRRGARIECFQGDAGSAQDVARCLQQIRDTLPPLRGVFHAAGVLDDGVLVQQTAERFARVMRPKVAGAWNLHAATQDLPLDFFVLFSSMAAILGSVGQGPYAAANAYMDALAWHRRSRALPALSINWGAWDRVGMASGLDLRDQLRIAGSGVELIQPQHGLAILESLLCGQSGSQVPLPCQIGVFPVDWGRAAQADPQIAALSILAEIIDQGKARANAREVPAFARRELLTAEAQAQRVMLLSYLRRQVARELLVREEEIAENQPLMNLGFDSLMAVQVKNRLETDLGLTVPVVELLDNSTITQIAETLFNLLQKRPAAPDHDSRPSEMATPAEGAWEEGDI